jgi:hypothetical protein
MSTWIGTGLRKIAIVTTGFSNNRRGQMRKDRNKIGSVVTTSRKTDSALWRDATYKSLTYTQQRIRSLCEAFQAGYITKDQFEQELPPILNLRDREKRKVNL